MASTKFVRDRARMVLEGLGITAPPVPLREIVEAEALRIELVEREDAYDGELVPELRLIRLNSRKPEARQRFTLAHELGHWVLYHKDRLHEFPEHDAATPSLEIEDSGYDEEDPFDDEDWAPDPEVEDFWAAPVDLGPRRAESDREANIFAAELLMPTSWIRRDGKATKDVLRLAQLYQVSQEAMWYRLLELGLIRK